MDSRNQQDRKCFEKTAHRPICRLPHIDCLCLALLGSHIWATPRSIKEVSQSKIGGSNLMYPVYHSRSLTPRYRYRYSSTETFDYPTPSQVWITGCSERNSKRNKDKAAGLRITTPCDWIQCRLRTIRTERTRCKSHKDLSNLSEGQVVSIKCPQQSHPHWFKRSISTTGLDYSGAIL